MYRLTTSMPYLLNRVGVRMGALFSRRIESCDITLPMYRVLAALVERPDAKLTDLAVTTSAEMSTMSRLIGQLVAKKLVTRERLPSNERTVSINLTPLGRDLVERLMPEAQHYEDVAMSGLTPDEVAKLRHMLDRVYESLDVLDSEFVAPLDEQ